MDAAHDTIVACASPWGRGAVAVLRLSGPQARALGEALCPGGPPWRSRRASLRRARGAAGEVLDEVLVTWMPGPASYTGEDVVELSCHGNPALVQRLLEALVALGARPARPGEYTRRAVERGRLSLVQAEAVDALVRARSLGGVAHAQRAAASLAPWLAARRERLLDLAAELEARVDHPGEDLGVLDEATLIARLDALAAECAALAGTWREGRRLVEGAVVALVGPVNAGKSSLFNQLAGRPRALVSPEPGTTRDVVEQAVLLDGVEVRLLDTAGEREGATPLEAAGLALAAELAEGSDLHLLVVPADRPPDPVEAALRARLGARPVVVVGTHADRGAPRRADLDLAVSNTTGEGLDALRSLLARQLAATVPAAREAVVATQRQHALLRALAAHAAEAARALEGAAGPAVAAEALTAALERLDELDGTDTREAVLDRVFARFCLGK